MIEDLQTIYKGKATIIKNKQYLSTKDYVSPFVERFKDITDKFICNVKSAEQISYDEKTIDVVYNRVLITAVFPEKYDITIDKNIYHRVVSMAYNLDVKSPYCKFYTGVLDSNANFYAFGSDCITMQEIRPEEAIDYTSVKTVIENGSKDQCQKMLEQIQKLVLKKSDMKNLLGEWVDYTIKKEYINDSGKTKLASNIAIEAYKNLTINKDSDFYSDLESFPLLDAYKAWASQISSDEKDINSRYEKTQLINQLFKL